MYDQLKSDQDSNCIVIILLTLFCFTELLKMTVGVLTTCHTQYTSDSSICVYYLIEQRSQVFVTYLTGVLYVHPL